MKIIIYRFIRWSYNVLGKLQKIEVVCPKCNTLNLIKATDKYVCHNCYKMIRKVYENGMPPYDWEK